jgi:hypothetical protein
MVKKRIIKGGTLTFSDAQKEVMDKMFNSVLRDINSEDSNTLIEEFYDNNEQEIILFDDRNEKKFTEKER